MSGKAHSKSITQQVLFELQVSGFRFWFVGREPDGVCVPPGIVGAPWAKRLENLRMRPKITYLMPVA